MPHLFEWNFLGDATELLARAYKRMCHFIIVSLVNFSILSTMSDAATSSADCNRPDNALYELRLECDDLTGWAKKGYMVKGPKQDHVTVPMKDEPIGFHTKKGVLWMAPCMSRTCNTNHFGLVEPPESCESMTKLDDWLYSRAKELPRDDPSYWTSTTNTDMAAYQKYGGREKFLNDMSGFNADDLEKCTTRSENSVEALPREIHVQYLSLLNMMSQGPLPTMEDYPDYYDIDDCNDHTWDFNIYNRLMAQIRMTLHMNMKCINEFMAIQNAFRCDGAMHAKTKIGYEYMTHVFAEHNNAMSVLTGMLTTLQYALNSHANGIYCEDEDRVNLIFPTFHNDRAVSSPVTVAFDDVKPDLSTRQDPSIPARPRVVSHTMNIFNHAVPMSFTPPIKSAGVSGSSKMAVPAGLFSEPESLSRLSTEKCGTVGYAMHLVGNIKSFEFTDESAEFVSTKREEPPEILDPFNPAQKTDECPCLLRNLLGKQFHKFISRTLAQ